MSQDITSLGIAVDATQAKTASKTLDELALSGGRAEQSTNALANATAVLSKVYGDLAKAAVAWKVYDYVKDATLLNARYETLGISMTQVGKNVGYTAEQMEAAAKALQKTGISMTESRASAMKLVQAHIDLADSTKLARIAQDAAVIGGINSSEAFSRLVHGVQSAQVEILRGIGINVSFEEGYAKTAATLGKTAVQLTENEKSQSRLNQVMEKGTEISGTYEAAMSTAGKQMSSMQRYTEDLKVKIGEVFNETLTIGVMAFTDQMKNLNGEMDAVAASGQLNDWAEGVTNLFVTIADNANNLVGALKVIGYTMAALAAASNLEVWDSSGRSAIKEQYDRDVDAVYAGEDRFSKALEKRRTARAEDAAKLAEVDSKKLEQVRSDMSAYAQALEQGLLTQQQYALASAAIMKNAYGDNHTYTDSTPAGKPTKKGPSEYDTLIKGIQEKIAMDNLDIQTQGQLTGAQKEAAKVMEDLRLGTLKLTVAQKTKLTGLLETRIAVDELKGIEERAAKQAQADATARIKAQDAAFEATIEGYYASEKGARDAVAAEELRIAQFGKTKIQIEEMTIATLVLAQTRVKSDTFEYASLQRQIESRQELLGLMKTSKGLEDQKAASAAEAASWKSIWDSVDKTAHDTFVNIFNGGQDAFTKLRDTLKSTLLDLLYQMTIKKWIINISASMSGGSGGTAGNVLSAASGGSNILNLISTGASAFSGTMATGFMNTVAGTGAGAGLNAAGAMMSNGSYAAGAGMGIGAVAPYVMAALVVKEMMQYKITPQGNGITATVGANGLPSGKVGTYSQFEQVGGLGGGGTTTNRDWGEADAGTTGYVGASAKNATDANRAYAKSLGLSTEALDSYTYSMELNTTGMDAAATQAAIDSEILKFSSGQVSSAYGDMIATYARAGETSTETLQRLSTDLYTVNGVMTMLGGTLYEVSAAGANAASGLVAAMGGMAAFQSQMSSYYQSYYSQAEQKANVVGQVSADLNAAGITGFTSDQISGASKSDIRAAVEQFEAGKNTEDGAKRYAAAVKAANMLSQYSTAVESVTAAVQPAIQAIGGSGGGGGGGGGGSSLVSALRGLTDAIYDEVNRIKGLVAGDSLMGYAEAQAAFAIGTASARSGNQEALKALPQLSQNLLQLAESNTTTLQELNYVRGTTAASLLTTAGMNGGLPSFDVGTDYVPQDMNARIHKGEKITPAKYNNNDSELAGLLVALGSKLDGVVTELEKIKKSNQDISDITLKSDTIGPAPARAVA